MKRTDQNEVIEYFKGKAKEYDLVDGQVYWRLSDKLLWSILIEKVLSNLEDNFGFLDAGGGTGRWSEKILRTYEKSRGVIYDLSPDMLAQADIKRRDGLENRLDLKKGSIEDMSDISDGTFDLSFNFHNVLGFVSIPQQAIKEMSRVTKKRGYVVSVVPNLYHCVFFNLMVGRVEEAQIVVEQKRGRFTPDMPYIHFFTPESIEQLYKDAGLTIVETFGFPVTVYPGVQETQISGSSERLMNLLEVDGNFDRVYELEKQLITEGSAARGNNLFVVGKK